MKNIIVALDGMDKDKALYIANEIKEYIWGIKLNDLLDRYGVDIITEFKNKGINVFADPKLKDIPNTVKNRVKHYENAGADFVTVCADGGVEMVKSAVDNTKNCKVLVVTVLTSLDKEQCLHIYDDVPFGAVRRFASDAVRAGAEGIICSPMELMLKLTEIKVTDKYMFGECLNIVTPGIRPKWYCKEDDQKRITTPYEAMKNGADYLVIGRPITQAKDIKHAAELTYSEVNLMIDD